MPFDPCDTNDTDPVARAETLIAQGEARRAADLLRQWRLGGHGGILADLVLVRALLAAGDGSSALEAARGLALAHPQVATAALALGNVFANLGQLPLAIAEIQRALRIDPGYVEARAALAEAWLEAGEPDRALEEVAQLEDEAFPGVPDLILRAKDMRLRERSDPGYVRHLFDQFSASYDARMQHELLYAAPAILKELADLLMPNSTALSILDMGCGTGLAGSVFAPLAARLDGIDLSPRMIERARSRGIYDELMVGDIEQQQEGRRHVYDLVLAADAFVYLGNLAKVLSNIAKLLRPRGWLFFTVEKEEGEAFSIGPKRRWRHSASYLRSEAERSGFAIAGLLDCVPRKEAGEPVSGLAAAFQYNQQKS